MTIPIPSASAQGTVTFGTNVYAYLSGLGEVPQNGSLQSAGGSLSAYFTQDGYGNTPVHCQVNLPLSFVPTGAGIYGPATTSQNGPLLFDLGQSAIVTNVTQVPFQPPVTTVSLIYSKSLSFTPSQLTNFYQGLYYINVRSAAYPQGELRGQLNNRPVLLQPMIEGQDTFFFALNAPGYINYQLQVSTNLVDWYGIDHAIFGPGPGGFADQHDPIAPHRFYRVKVQ